MRAAELMRLEEIAVRSVIIGDHDCLRVPQERFRISFAACFAEREDRIGTAAPRHGPAIAAIAVSDQEIPPRFIKMDGWFPANPRFEALVFGTEPLSFFLQYLRDLSLGDGETIDLSE